MLSPYSTFPLFYRNRIQRFVQNSVRRAELKQEAPRDTYSHLVLPNTSSSNTQDSLYHHLNKF